MSLTLPIDIDAVKGFLSRAEGEALYESAAHAESGAPALEIGSYCGKSTVYLGLGCQQAGRALLALDHHRGSEEHQPGEMFHDPELTDEQGAVDTLRSFRATLTRAGLNETVVPVLASSAQFAQVWQGGLSLVFIDGGHSLAAALKDYRGWTGFIQPGGLLAIHDVYPKPEDGGQAPITVYRLAQASGLFREVTAVDSLRVLQKLT
ncbi:MAG: class I SAM-dependent methyltransferase [Congregibacter sp.]